jgi:hypothetical protein
MKYFDNLKNKNKKEERRKQEARKARRAPQTPDSTQVSDPGSGYTKCVLRNESLNGCQMYLLRMFVCYKRAYIFILQAMPRALFPRRQRINIRFVQLQSFQFHFLFKTHPFHSWTIVRPQRDRLKDFTRPTTN